MLSPHNIWTVAFYEIKILLRSWFLRIFAGISIAIILFFDLALFASIFDESPWVFKGIASSMPYFNILCLNTAQAVIALFLASDFLKRDKKLNTTEVIYMRSMTNGDYVLGKSLGNLIVFLALNLVILLGCAIINILVPEMPFDFSAYILYPLIMSVPTLIFVFGVTYFIMSIIRNQAVTIIILLGYIAVLLFFAKGHLNYVFDAFAFYLPLMSSDFVGFGNHTAILWQRAIYLFFGAGFVFATILMLRRLPQSRSMQRWSAVLTVVFIFCALAAAVVQIEKSVRTKKLRNRVQELNEQHREGRRVTVSRCLLDLVHDKNTIEVEAALVFKNKSLEPVDNYLFNLNPGLEITGVENSSGKLDFTRDVHLITVTPDTPLGAGEIDSLKFFYRGRIDERIAYTDIDNETRQKTYRVWMYKIEKRFAFVNPRFVLLTAENMWYPSAGLPRHAVFPDKWGSDFIDFELNVRTEKNLVAISQGQMSSGQSGSFQFRPEKSLPFLSLVIGDYEKRSVTADETEYALFTKSRHDYFVPFFADMGDTLAALIGDARQQYENKLGLAYPFSRFALVEVPIQFFAYSRLTTIQSEIVQPEMVLCPENGVLIQMADFKGNQARFNRRRQRSNVEESAQEQQSRTFEMFVNMTFLREGGTGLFGGGMTNFTNYYGVLPNMYTFVNNIHSEKWPVLNSTLEAYLSNKLGGQMRGPFGNNNRERANLALRKKTFKQLLVEQTDPEVLKDVLKKKGNFLISSVKMSAGDEFDGFFYDFLTTRRHCTTDVDDLLGELNDRFRIDLAEQIDNWYTSEELPGFLFSDIRAYEIVENDRTRYQVLFKVQNGMATDGLLSVTFRAGGGFGRFFGGGPEEPDDETLVHVSGFECKEVGIVVDDQPRALNIDTFVSLNIPSTISRRFEKLERRDRAQPFSGERILDESLHQANPGEVIIDNEDEGFIATEETSQSLLQRILKIEAEEVEEYDDMIRPWRIPETWRKVTDADLYGLYIHSGRYIKAGSGNKRVKWQADLQDAGTYDVYVYTRKFTQRWGRRRNDRQRLLMDLHYFINHDDGTESVVVETESAEEGWNLLGSFYFSSGEASVELSDLSEGQAVVADAVKWVKR